MSTDLVKIVIPQATTNLVTNPSFETNTTGWSANLSATISQSNEQSRWGRYSLKVVAAATIKSGAKTSNFTNLSGDDIVVSAWVHAPNNQSMRLIIHDATAASDVTTTTFTGTGAWQRVEALNTSFTATNNMYILIGADDTGAPTFYVDGVMYEEWPTEGIAVATTYCDGDQSGCEWNGVEHASTSGRSGDTRAGGQILDLDDNANLKVRHIDGFGVLPYSHQSQPTPLLPGALFKGIHAEPRVLTILMASTTKDRATYHTAREQLVDRLKHHATTSVEPVKIIYDSTREIEAYYDTGLEAVLDSPYLEQFALRFICYDPYWKEIGENSTEIGNDLAIVSSNIIKRVNGTWGSLDTDGVNNDVHTIAYHPARNSFFIGGSFTTAGDDPVTVNFITEYDHINNTFSDLDTGTNGTVNSIVVAGNGDVYVGGSFTTVGSAATTANRLARWDPSAGSWVAGVGDVGCNGLVRKLALSANKLWIGGEFSTAGGVTVNKITYWDGNTFYAMDSGVNGNVWGIDATEDTVVVSGAFTTAGAAATTVNRVCTWDISSAAWSAMGTGMNNDVRAVLFAKDGQTVYATGDFTTASGDTANRLAVWNGTVWAAMGSGLNDIGDTLSWGHDGSLYIGGNFTQADGDTRCEQIARWIGGVFVPVDLTWAPTTTSVDAIVSIKNATRDILMIGHKATSLTVGASGVTTITNNGTAKAYPVFKIYITPTSTWDTNMQSITNHTTGHELFFDLELFADEVVSIDLRPGVKRIYSNFRDNLTSKMYPNSDFSEFHLAPGDNVISFWYTATESAQNRWVMWRDAYESFD